MRKSAPGSTRSCDPELTSICGDVGEVDPQSRSVAATRGWPAAAGQGARLIGVDLRSTQRGRLRADFNRSRPAVESARGRPRAGVDRSRPTQPDGFCYGRSVVRSARSSEASALRGRNSLALSRSSERRRLASTCAPRALTEMRRRPCFSISWGRGRPVGVAGIEYGRREAPGRGRQDTTKPCARGSRIPRGTKFVFAG